MAILRVSGLSKYFGQRMLFTGVSFEIAPGDRVGLVGVNGCGKTTLFNILRGTEPHEEGQVSFAKECMTASMEQTVEIPAETTVYDAVLAVFSPLMQLERDLQQIADQLEKGEGDVQRLINRQARLMERYEQDGGLTYRSRTRSALTGLGFSERELEKSYGFLSGGEARKVLLARVLLSGANLLLLDEPTNHLDIAGVEWLEDFLESFQGALIVISHDRYFLDKVTTRTMELVNGTLHATRGGYSRHVELRMDQREIAIRHYQAQQKEIKRIEGIIAQQRRWNQERNYVTIASKEKQIERIRSAMVEPEPLPPALRFHFRAMETTANEIVAAKGLSKSFGERTLFQNADFLIKKNERVCLIGANGCGKTTLLKILTGQEEPDGGAFKIAPNMRIGYYEQSLTGFNPDNTILEELSGCFPRLDNSELRNTLGIFLFRGDAVFTKMGALSGGELARIQLLKLMLRGSNMLILDEPTNHLDIASMETLENALSEYGGTMLIVTHDRYFVNRIADRILILSEEGVSEFIGDWDAYRQQLTEKKPADAEEAPKANAPNGYQKNKELRSRINRLKGELKRAEERIALLEKQSMELEAGLALPENAADYQRAADYAQRIADNRAQAEEAYQAYASADEELQTLMTEVEI